MSNEATMELPKRLDWLNAAPYSLHEQRGRVVALAFVSASSAWCWQRLAELAIIQARFPGRVQVIVVHVPRFDSEREPQRALKLLRRRGVAFPIAHDADWAAWQGFGIESWPTVVLFDAEGMERHRLSGAPLGPGDLERYVATLCDGSPNPSDADLRPTVETNAEPRLPLRFPVGLAVSDDRLYVADSGRHRVLECNHAGRILREFGTGAADFIDGAMEQAAFNRPQGLVLARDFLYVADTGNHSLRRITLRNGDVDTLCGTGKAGEPREGVLAIARDSALDHPHGLAIANNLIYIALAGDNRIWSFDLGRNELKLRAGSGALEVRDGAGGIAAFAQPIALAAVQQSLYVCDALGSAVRSCQVRTDVVQTLLGQGPWEFGDDDGPRSRARLQHPQALALSPDAPLLWIADSGNGTLRTLRLGGGELSTVALPRRLHGPAGLAIGAGAVWIAETDAHAVLRFDIASGELGDVPIGE